MDTPNGDASSRGWPSPAARGVFAPLVGALVFKTSGGFEQSSQWVRFPYTPALFPDRSFHFRRFVFGPVPVAPHDGLRRVFRVRRVGARQLAKQEARALGRDDLSHPLAVVTETLIHGMSSRPGRAGAAALCNATRRC